MCRAPVDQSIAINKTQFFKPVPQVVWEFHIGGYQVLDKYLKSRKGRVLSLDEINYVGAIADSLVFTIEQMARIDEAYRAAFGEAGISARDPRISLYRTIFPQMTLWLLEHEGAQLRFEFETELARLEAA